MPLNFSELGITLAQSRQLEPARGHAWNTLFYDTVRSHILSLEGHQVGYNYWDAHSRIIIIEQDDFVMRPRATTEGEFRVIRDIWNAAIDVIWWRDECDVTELIISHFFFTPKFFIFVLPFTKTIIVNFS